MMLRGLCPGVVGLYFTDYGTQVSLGGSKTLKIVIPVENHP